ncbi:PREDICTED: uncharacterized protein LOC109479099, partial [Branchiostoma belcheri]|uniref:Uncharacterized protein LOC109479099 n=1 Tax=Branchiostoma belcheri TaxID=7741 RepID=A0A6P4ZZZ3_BRABE
MSHPQKRKKNWKQPPRRLRSNEKKLQQLQCPSTPTPPPSSGGTGALLPPAAGPPASGTTAPHHPSAALPPPGPGTAVPPKTDAGKHGSAVTTGSRRRYHGHPSAGRRASRQGEQKFPALDFNKQTASAKSTALPAWEARGRLALLQYTCHRLVRYPWPVVRAFHHAAVTRALRVPTECNMDWEDIKEYYIDGDASKLKNTTAVATSLQSTTNASGFQKNEICQSPFGMESGAIPDDSITASGVGHHYALDPHLGRLNGTTHYGAWGPAMHIIGQWLQVDLGGIKRVTGIITQGAHSPVFNQLSWVTTFKLEYSGDETFWTTYADSDGSDMIFTGNTDPKTPVTNLLDNPVDTRYVRFYPQRWHGRIAMRVEILGCSTEFCQNPLGMESGTIPDDSITASGVGHHYLLHPYFGRLKGTAGWGGWGSARYNGGQWLQVDLGVIKRVTGVTTQGAFQPVYHQYSWVTSYKLQYSGDGTFWTTYADSDGSDKVFTGNTDTENPVTNLLGNPVDARYVRFNPQRWHHRIAMRVEILGCSTEILWGLTLNDAGMSHLNVSWTVVGNLPISRYTLRYQPADGSGSYQDLSPAPEAGDTSATVLGLMDHTEYTLTLTSFDDNDQPNGVINGTFTTVCQSPLGMESGAIPDDSITASSVLTYVQPYFGRLKGTAGVGGWASAGQDRTQWLQVDLGVIKRVTGIVTQGAFQPVHDQYSWVTSYKLQYSGDGTFWTTYANSDGSDKVFTGNTDEKNPVTNLLDNPVDARYVQFYPQRWHHRIAMRVEILGCSTESIFPVCQDPFGMESGAIHDDNITASSVGHSHLLRPYFARLKGTAGWGAWGSGHQIIGEWLQVFTGNTDTKNPVTNLLDNPVDARYVRIYPQSWYGYMAMRVEILGCETELVGNLPISRYTLRYQPADGSGSYQDLSPAPGADATSAAVLGLMDHTEYILTLTSFDQDDQPNGAINGTFTTVCQYPLGMESGAIHDDNITASSVGHSHLLRPYFARLKGTAGWGGWGSGYQIIGEWLQVDLGVIKRVTGMTTQGALLPVHHRYSWVTSYKLRYSGDKTFWTTYANSDGSDKVFTGNTDTKNPVTNLLDNPVDARYVRFYPQRWHHRIAMRVEILGCAAEVLLGLTLNDAGMSHLNVSWTVVGNLPISRYTLRYQPADGSGSYQDLSPAPGAGDTSAAVVGLMDNTEYTLTLTSFDEDDQPNGVINGTFTTVCQNPLGMESGAIPDDNITGPGDWHHHMLQPYFGRLKGSAGWGGWMGRMVGHWLQVDLGAIKRVTGTVTQGALSPINNYYSWVTSYKLVYSGDKTFWTTYANSDGSDKVFTGNTDTENPVTNLLDNPVHARYVRFYPQRWHIHMAMRVEILGCGTEILWGPTLNDAGMNHLNVSWTVVGNLPISRYTLRYQPADGSGSYQDLSPAPGAGDTSAAVVGLMDNTEYTLTLTSFDEDDQPNGVINGTFTTVCQNPLGMESGAIPDDNITGPGDWHHHMLQPYFGRLKGSAGWGGWMGRMVGHWLQVDLGAIKRVTGTVTQGALSPINSYYSWVTSYKLVYSGDKTFWTTYANSDGSDKVFTGNTDTENPVTNLLDNPVHARYVRFYPQRWHIHMAMRVEILGCGTEILWGPTLNDAGMNHLNVSWTVVGNLPISRYTLRYQPADGSGSYQDLSPAPGAGGTSATVVGLMDHTEYTLTLTSFDEDDQPNGVINGTYTTVCQNPLGMESGAIPDDNITASGNWRHHMLQPYFGRLKGTAGWGGWGAIAGQWLQEHEQELFDHINTEHDSIKFTIEREQDNRLPMLDVMMVRNPDNTITTDVFRKQTHTDHYLQWFSNHPVQQKLGIVRTLMHRANTLTEDPALRETEKEKVRVALRHCGYPEWALREGENNSRKDKSSKEQSRTGKQEQLPASYLVLPYIHGVTERLKRVYAKHNVSLYSKPGFTLRNALVRPKDPLAPGEKCGNTDTENPVTNLLSHPVNARYVRFNPQSWHHRIAMRVEILGCRANSR